ncbi:hypothetical protein Ocin01_06725 [Orchesella cincta]|uniref:MRH domain-containing protein n=1 Tax=Orchesella cincta TaxID=48709 RepID=A0A1D2N3X3_ORCCI|nr:hypothetical protein Ocin01_06725 [Orchesella cincta]
MNAACEAGQFLNLTTVQCEDCEAGTYSLGGGLRFDEWDPLPTGFRTQVEKFHSMFSTFGRQYADVNCSKWGWRSRGDMLISQGGPCVATLTYTAQLVKPGSLRFTYQYADDSVLFQFQANSEQCESLREAEGSRWPPLTGEGSWRTEEISLHTGLNIFQWKTVGIDAHRPKPVIIKRIELEGVGYTSSCNPCPPGFFSDMKASKTCYPCKRDFYANKKSTICTPCDKNEYYAEPGSSQCLRRPACTTSDYYSIHAPCNANNQTQVVYKWIEPKICLETREGAVELPAPKPLEECPPCNPGTEYRDGSCQSCPTNYFSDGLTTCSSCPANTVPERGHYMTQWYSWPHNVHTTCISPEGNGCSSSPAWQLNGKYIQSGKGHASWVYLVMTVSVGGFRGLGGMINGELLEVGRLDFTFEVKCAHDCELLFMQGTRNKNASVIQRWIGSQPRQEFTHKITRNDTYDFSWCRNFYRAFQKLEWDSLSTDSPAGNSWGGTDSTWEKPALENDDNWVKIYNLNVVNSIDGGANGCSPCRDGQRLSRINTAAFQTCISCGPGQYLAYNNSSKNIASEVNSTQVQAEEGEPDGSKCIPCPPGTVTVDPFAIGTNSCRPCGPGLISKNGVQCTTDCMVKLGEYTYDLRPLKGFHAVRGSSLFTASGTQYYHVFNISFCAESNAHCYKNVSLQPGMMNENSRVEALVCQSTIFPPAVGQAFDSTDNAGYEGYMNYISKPISTHASSLGDHLVGISHSPSILGISVADEIHDHIKFPHQLHFFFSTPELPSTNLASDQANEVKSEIRAPDKCPDATCDGCNFHFIWETPFACHICNENELTIVKGECKDGMQDVHYLATPDSDCLLSINATWPKIQKCQNHLPFFVEVAIQVAVGLTTLLSIMLICFWRRHRKLEYKYMKLMASGGSSGMGHSGNVEESNTCERDMLPVAESCALDPNEDEDDDDNLHHNGHRNSQLSGQIKEVGFYSDSALRNLVSRFSILDKLKSFTRKVNAQHQV